MKDAPESELGLDDIIVWNEMWNDLHLTHYNSYYEELCAEHSVKLLGRFDAVFKIAELSTASGSAIAGWTLWHLEGFRAVWAILAGSTVVLSIVHSVLKISDKIETDTLAYSVFKSIRLQCERLRSNMKIRVYERLADYKNDFKYLTSQFDSASANQNKPDFLLSKSTEEKIQSKLNRIIEAS